MIYHVLIKDSILSLQVETVQFMLNYFVTPTDAIALPLSFPSPFVAEPHPLCRLAAEELQQYIGQQADWKTELQQGKMFGVLVVKTS